jgi:PAN domain/HdeA/HdeB family
MIVLLAAPARGEAAESIALDKYTCAEFLSDTTQTTDGNKLLKSLMMISWATGYAAAFQQKLARADAAAIALIAGALGDACRQKPEQTAVQAIIATIDRFAASAPAPGNGDALAAIKPNPIAKGGFNGFDNFDLPGGDLRRLERVDLDKCAVACESDRDCHAYSYDKWNRWCFLKSKPTTLTLDPGSTSAVKSSSVQPASSIAAVRMEDRTAKAFAGADHQMASGLSVESCQERCRQDRECLGYTYLKKDKSCHLFTDITTFTADTAAMSGFKTQSPP